MPKTETAILTPEQVEEIAVRDWHLNGALEKRIALSPVERDALVAMVRTFNEHYENLMRAALLREQNTADQMRSACIEKVKAMRNEWESATRQMLPVDAIESDEGRYIDAAEEIIEALESVSIQEQEAKQ